MSIIVLRISVVLLTGLGLAACTTEEINTAIANIKGDTPPAAEQPAAVPSIEPPRYTVLDGNGPTGEVLAEGPDCHNSFRTQICMDQPSPYPWWPTTADLQHGT